MAASGRCQAAPAALTALPSRQVTLVANEPSLPISSRRLTGQQPARAQRGTDKKAHSHTPLQALQMGLHLAKIGIDCLQSQELHRREQLVGGQTSLVQVLPTHKFPRS